MLRRVGLGLLGVLGLAAACSEDAPAPSAMPSAGAKAGGSAGHGGMGGTRAAAGSRSDGGVSGGGTSGVNAAGKGGGVAALGGAGGDGGVGGDAGASASAGARADAGAGGDAGARGVGGSAGEAGQGPGVCEAALPTQLPACAPAAPDPDGGNECRVCLQAQCCEVWQACFGEKPRNACGYGAPVGDEIGEADCVALCWYEQREGTADDSEILAACASSCGACGEPTETTSDLLACAYERCQAECFPRP